MLMTMNEVVLHNVSHSAAAPTERERHKSKAPRQTRAASIVGDAKRSLGLLRTLGGQDCSDLLRVAH